MLLDNYFLSVCKFKLATFQFFFRVLPYFNDVFVMALKFKLMLHPFCISNFRKECLPKNIWNYCAGNLNTKATRDRFQLSEDAPENKQEIAMLRKLFFVQIKLWQNPVSDKSYSINILTNVVQTVGSNPCWDKGATLFASPNYIVACSVYQQLDYFVWNV